MIKADSEKGVYALNGPFDDILFEYTIVTKIIINQLTEMKDEEFALTMLAKLGQIAANNAKDLPKSAQNIYDTVEEVLKEHEI